jgi:tetratricopeptide (TPR) repeat protein
MAKGLSSILGLLLLLPAGAAADGKTRPGDARALIEEGVRLHDAGKYDEAIAKYREALAIDPGNLDATYEIAYAQFALGRYDECVATAKPLIDRAGPLKAAVYVVLANCHDLAGDPKKALRLFEKGMKEFPKDAVIPFNAGVTRARREEWTEARKLFQRAIENDPIHRSAHLNLGVAYRVGGYRVQAILAYLRFLSLEPEGPRAQGTANEILYLLGAGFSKTGEAEYKVEFNVDLPKDEGDYASAELVRAIGGAVIETEEWQDKSAGEKLVYRIDSLLASIDEGGGEGGRDFARANYMPFVRALRDAGMLETFVYRFFAPVGPPELATWLDQHPEQVALLDGFLASQARR